MDQDTNGALATYYAAIFNGIQQAGGEIGDELLEQCNDCLQDSDWVVEFDKGVWQARTGEVNEE
jgi:hypothetical protein